MFIHLLNVLSQTEVLHIVSLQAEAKVKFHLKHNYLWILVPQVQPFRAWKTTTLEMNLEVPVLFILEYKHMEWRTETRQVWKLYSSCVFQILTFDKLF